MIICTKQMNYEVKYIMILNKVFVPERMEHNNDKYVLQNLLYRLEANEIDLSPQFQREFVWGKKLQEALILSIFLGNPLGPLTLWKNEGTKKVTDGKQRLSTLQLFHKDELSIHSEAATRIIFLYKERLEELSEAEVDKEMSKSEKEILKIERSKAKKLLNKLSQKNPQFKFSDLILDMQRDFLNFQNPVIEVIKATEEQIRDYFRRIQHQEKLKAGEIINSIQSTVLTKIISNISDISLLKERLGFKKDRREFEKIYYSIVGILEGRLNLGLADKDIIAFAEEIDKREETFHSNIELMNKLDILNKNLNEIIELNFNLELLKSDLKFLLLLCAYDFFDLTKKYDLKTIMLHFAKVVKKFKAFYTPTRTRALSKYFSETNTETSLIKRYEDIAALRQGNHNLNNVIKHMKELVELIAIDIGETPHMLINS